jgi:hypothetical protein
MLGRSYFETEGVLDHLFFENDLFTRTGVGVVSESQCPWTCGDGDGLMPVQLLR